MARQASAAGGRSPDLTSASRRGTAESRALVKELQEKAARALPATIQEHKDGCWLRYTDSTMWWVGASLMHGRASGGQLIARITAVEDFYAAHGGPVRIQVCPACPPDLDRALANRGYARGPAMSLQAAPTDEVARLSPATPLAVELADRPDPTWLAVWMTSAPADVDPAPEQRLLSRVEQASCYVAALSGGRPVAVGRAVVDAGWTGVFGMATVPNARRQGGAGAVLAALAGWAREHHAPRMYLQVEQDNGAALRLYERAGFRPVCRYHYRSSPPS